MYRCYFEDSLEPVEWYETPHNTLGPYKTAWDALEDLGQKGITDPADFCYILMTEDQAAQLRIVRGLQASTQELAVVKAALNLFIHANLGRADTVMERIVYSGVRHDGRQLSVAESHEARALLTAASEILTGSRNGGPGIFADRVSNSARLAYRVTARIDGDALREGMVDADGNRA